MPFRFDLALEAVMPDLPSPQLIFTVPLEGSAAVEKTQLVSEFPDLIGPDEHMIVIRQNAPREDLFRKRFARREHSAFAVGHS